MCKTENILLGILLLIFSVLTVYFIFGGVISNIVISGETTINLFSTFIPNFQNADYFYKMFFSSNHSFFLVSFVNHLCAIILPVWTDMHPQDFYIKYGWHIFLFIFYAFCCIQTFNSTKYLKPNVLNLLAFWIVLAFVICSFKTTWFIWALYNDTWFLCYVFNSIFPLLLFVILEKNYVTTGDIIPTLPEEKRNLIYLLGILFLIFLVGISHELYRFVLCGTLAITFILNNKLFRKKIEIKKFLLIFSFSVIASCFIFLLPSFTSWWKLCVNTPVPQTMMYLTAFKILYQHTILTNLNSIALILVFSVAAWFCTNNKLLLKRLLIWVSAICFSLLLFNYLIIVISNLNTDISQHNGIKFLTNSILNLLIFSIIGFLISHCREKIKKFVNIELVLFCVFYALFAYCVDIEYVKYHIKASKYARQIQYIVEKSYDIYGKNKNVMLASYGTNTVLQDTIIYLKYLYGGSNKRYYKTVFICNPDVDNDVTCREKMVDFLYKKTNYLISKEELKETDFSEIEGYLERKKQGKFYIDFFKK